MKKCYVSGFSEAFDFEDSLNDGILVLALSKRVLVALLAASPIPKLIELPELPSVNLTRG